MKRLVAQLLCSRALALLCALAAGAAPAEPAEATKTVESADPTDKSEDSESPVQVDSGLLDRGHDSVERNLVNWIDGLDRFFADENYSATTNESFVRIAPGILIRDGGQIRFKPRFRLNLQLPRTERRIGLVLSSRNADEDDLLDGGSADDDGFGAGLRAAIFDNRKTKLRLTAGSRFRPEPDPFVRLRLIRLRPVGGILLRPSITGSWELEDGLGERMRLDVDMPTGPRSLVRLRGDASYGESTEGHEFRASITHFFALRERTAWRLEGRIDSHTRPVTEVTQYRALLRYRWSMLRPWLFFEIEPGIRFVREDGFDPAPEAIFRVEIVFGSRKNMGIFEAGTKRSPAYDDSADSDDD